MKALVYYYTEYAYIVFFHNSCIDILLWVKLIWILPQIGYFPDILQIIIVTYSILSLHLILFHMIKRDGWIPLCLFVLMICFIIFFVSIYSVSIAHNEFLCVLNSWYTCMYIYKIYRRNRSNFFIFSIDKTIPKELSYVQRKKQWPKQVHI